MDRKRAPAAADVEHPIARPQRELRADELELGLLRLLERLCPAVEERTGVGHRAVQEQREELVGDVVVMADRPGIAALGVRAPLEHELGCGSSRRPHEPRRSHPGRHQPQTGPEPDLRLLPLLHELHHGVEIVDVQDARDVGTPEPQLARRPQQVGHRARGAHDEGRTAAGGGRQHATVPEPDTERTVWDRLGDRPAQRLGIREHVQNPNAPCPKPRCASRRPGPAAPTAPAA